MIHALEPDEYLFAGPRWHGAENRAGSFDLSPAAGSASHRRLRARLLTIAYRKVLRTKMHLGLALPAEVARAPVSEDDTPESP